jgi:hypothetical protein
VSQEHSWLIWTGATPAGSGDAKTTCLVVMANPEVSSSRVEPSQRALSGGSVLAVQLFWLKVRAKPFERRSLR